MGLDKVCNEDVLELVDERAIISLINRRERARLDDTLRRVILSIGY